MRKRQSKKNQKFCRFTKINTRITETAMLSAITRATSETDKELVTFIGGPFNATTDKVPSAAATCVYYTYNRKGVATEQRYKRARVVVDGCAVDFMLHSSLTYRMSLWLIRRVISKL